MGFVNEAQLWTSGITQREELELQPANLESTASSYSDSIPEQSLGIIKTAESEEENKEKDLLNSAVTSN